MKAGIHTFKILYIKVKSLGLSYRKYLPLSLVTSDYLSVLPFTKLFQRWLWSLSNLVFLSLPLKQAVPRSLISLPLNSVNNFQWFSFYDLSGAFHTFDLPFLLGNLPLHCFPMLPSCFPSGLSGSHLLCPFVASSISWTPLVSTAPHFPLRPSSPMPPTSLTLHWLLEDVFPAYMILLNLDRFIQQSIKQVCFDFPHITKLYIIAPPPHLLLMYALSQWTASTFTQKAKPKLY